MAKADIVMPDDFLERIASLGAHEDSIAEKVLEAGAAVVETKVRSNLEGVVGRNTVYPSRSTGELVSSLGVTKVRVNRNGDHDIKIGFAEPRSDGESNAKLANILEYGKHGQPPKPFLAPAKSATKAACMETMKKRFAEEVDKL